MQIYFPFFRIYLEEVFVRWTSAALDHCIWSQQSFEICYLQTWVRSWWLRDRPGKEHTVEYFYWDSMCDHRMSLGVWRDNFRCYFFWFHVNSWGCPEGCPTYTGKYSWKKKCWVFFSFFHLNIWKRRGKLMSYKQPTACGLHFGERSGMLLAMLIFASQKAEVLAEPRGDLQAAGFGCLASVAPQVFLSLARLAVVTAACGWSSVVLRHAIALMLFWWEWRIVLNEMAVWPGGMGRFFIRSMHRN